MTVLTELITPTLQLQDTGADNTLALTYNEDATADRVFNLVMGDADRTLTLSDNPTLGDWFDQSVKTTDAPTFTGLALTPGSAPGTPAEGDVYVNSSDHNIYFYNGSDWEDLAGAGGGGVTGSGTTSYIPKWTGSMSLGDSIIVDDGSDHIGIGTASPVRALDVYSADNNALGLRRTNWSDTDEFVFAVAGTAATELLVVQWYDASGPTTSDLFTIRSGGNVGIGTTSPARPLHVIGEVRLTPQADPPGSAAEGDVYADSDHNLYYYNGTGWDDLTAGGGTGLWTDDGAYYYPNNASNVAVTDTERLGVGTTNPLGKIDSTQSNVAGAIPSLYLYQADVDEPLIMFRGQATTGLGNNIVAEAEVSTATRAGWLRVEVQDDGAQIASQDYFIPIYTLA